MTSLMEWGALGEPTLIPDGKRVSFAVQAIFDSNNFTSGCDLPSHLYSFSFNLNPYWSKELCEQPEILQCKSTVYPL